MNVIVIATDIVAFFGSELFGRLIVVNIFTDFKILLILGQTEEIGSTIKKSNYLLNIVF